MNASTLKVGDSIPEFVRETGLENWNRFAAVQYEFVGIHMDDEAGRAAGYPTAFGMGNLQWAYLHNLMRGVIGDEGRIVSVNCQFRAPNTKGQVVTAKGQVTGIRDENGERFVELEVWTEEQTGAKLAPGTAVVAFPL